MLDTQIRSFKSSTLLVAVIRAYGATHIPNPSWLDMLPNKYYKDFKGHERPLHR